MSIRLLVVQTWVWLLADAIAVLYYQCLTVETGRISPRYHQVGLLTAQQPCNTLHSLIVENSFSQPMLALLVLAHTNQLGCVSYYSKLWRLRPDGKCDVPLYAMTDLLALLPAPPAPHSRTAEAVRRSQYVAHRYHHNEVAPNFAHGRLWHTHSKYLRPKTTDISTPAYSCRHFDRSRGPTGA
jgi:hypothetical protein